MRQLDDLDESILIFTKAIYLPLPLTLVTKDAPSSFLNIVQIFYHLATKVFFRAKDSGQPDDVRSCIQFFRYLHGQWHDISMTFPVPVTTVLVHTLAMQVALELGDVDQAIDDMAGLCDELLNADISIRFMTGPIEHFAGAINAHPRDHLEWRIRSEKAIDFLRKATLRLPGLHQVSMVLAQSLFIRFVVTPSGDDYEEGMAILDRILAFHGPGDEPSSHRGEALSLAALFSGAQFHAYGKPMDLEHAIYRHRALLDGTSIEDPNRAHRIDRLAYLQGMRLDGTANTQDAVSVPPNAEKLPSFRELIASFPGPMAAKPDWKELMKHVGILISRIDQLTDVADIKDGIKYCRLLLISYPHNMLATTAQSALGMLLDRAFRLTHEIGYLNEAISSTRVAINAVDSVSSRVALVGGLISYLSTRLELQCHEEDLHELMQLFPIVADYSHCKVESY